MSGYYSNCSDEVLVSIYDDYLCELSELEPGDLEESDRINLEVAELELELVKRGI